MTTPNPSGRLELTWTNKNLRLLADEDGGYEWVPPADFRVAEVRLLHPAGAVGDLEEQTPNLLVRGDALHALTSLTQLPEYRDRVVGRVKLCYIDPPFNTEETFEHYEDNLEHSVWLTMLRDRLLQIRELLAPDGSVWVHLDDNEGHRGRSVLDEVFGPRCFVGTVVWQKRYSRDNRPAIGPVHDFIHVYSPMGGAWKTVRNRVPRLGAKQYRNPNNDPRGLWRPIPLDAQAGHATEAQFYNVVTPAGAVHPPAKGRAWSVTQPRLQELVAEGRVYFGKDGKGKPNLIRYLDEDEGLVPWTWWPHDEVGHNDEAKKEILELFPEVEPFDTPKPERLLQRIIHIATNPGELVLDCFVGSGTTPAVAHKMGRRWIAIERSADTFATFALPRLTKVVNGEDLGGITAITTEASAEPLPEKITPSQVNGAAKTLKELFEYGTLAEELDESQLRALTKKLRSAARVTTSHELLWDGGGGFRILEVAPSMFERNDYLGVVCLSGWATGGALAEATAAQLGYAYEPDGPFAGKRGRTRLVVIDGLVNEAVVRLLVEALEDGQLLELAATSIDPTAAAVLRQLRRGSRIRKIPQAILRTYQRASRLRELMVPMTTGDTPLDANTNSRETKVAV